MELKEDQELSGILRILSSVLLTHSMRERDLESISVKVAARGQEMKRGRLGQDERESEKEEGKNGRERGRHFVNSLHGAIFPES